MKRLKQIVDAIDALTRLRSEADDDDDNLSDDDNEIMRCENDSAYSGAIEALCWVIGREADIETVANFALGEANGEEADLHIDN